ncbi:MAG: hypothetical protein K0R49_1274 [Burkholderiales bacterium]|jgi:hypothetical protein|nr:hypothetical protein [Burkholderiales bacterium]
MKEYGNIPVQPLLYWVLVEIIQDSIKKVRRYVSST